MCTKAPKCTSYGLTLAGGRQNATFGNVVELILSIAALTKGLTTVVAMSLLGSVLSNLLLVLGARLASLMTCERPGFELVNLHRWNKIEV